MRWLGEVYEAFRDFEEGRRKLCDIIVRVALAAYHAVSEGECRDEREFNKIVEFYEKCLRDPRVLRSESEVACAKIGLIDIAETILLCINSRRLDLVKYLIEFGQDGCKEVRIEALKTYRRCIEKCDFPEDVVEALWSVVRKAVEDDYDEVRLYAILAMHEIAWKYPKYREEAVKLLEERVCSELLYDNWHRAFLAYTSLKYNIEYGELVNFDSRMGRWCREGRVDDLIKALKSANNPYCKYRATRSLINFAKDPRVKEIFLELCKSRDPFLRLYAARGLREAGDSRAKECFLSLLDSGCDAAVYDACEYLLEYFAGELSLEELSKIKKMLGEMRRRTNDQFYKRLIVDLEAKVNKLLIKLKRKARRKRKK